MSIKRGVPMTTEVISVTLAPKQLQWMKIRNLNRSAYIRSLIDNDMEHGNL